MLCSRAGLSRKTKVSVTVLRAVRVVYDGTVATSASSTVGNATSRGTAGNKTCVLSVTVRRGATSGERYMVTAVIVNSPLGAREEDQLDLHTLIRMEDALAAASTFSLP